MLRVGDPRRWRKFPDGALLEFGDGERRKIVVEFNTEMPTSVHVRVKDATYFLGKVDGLDKVEFDVVDVNEPVGVTVTSEGEVWFYSDWFEIVDVQTAETPFTKAHIRRPVDPVLQRIMDQAKLNEMRRDAALHDMLARIEERARNADNSGTSGSDRGASAPSGEGEPGAGDATGADRQGSDELRSSSSGDPKPAVSENAELEGTATPRKA